MEFQQRIIDLEVPNDSAIFYYDAGIKIAIEEMEKLKHFLEKVGEVDSLNRMYKAILAMQSFSEAIQGVKTDILSDYAAMQHMEGEEEEPEMGIMPNLETESLDDLFN